MNIIRKIVRKLHFITLNYTLYSNLHLKLFEFTFCILNYGPCYTLHLNVNFVVNLDKKYDTT